MKLSSSFIALVVCVMAPCAPGSANERERPAPAVFGTSRAAQSAGQQSGAPASLVLIAGIIGSKAAYGCAVIVGDDRSTVTLLTAKHNLQIQRPAYITVAGERLRIERTAPVEGHDLAVVTASRPWHRYDVARVALDAPPGTRVTVWGPIGDEPFTLHEGTVRELDPRVTDAPAGAFGIDCASCGHGDSGTGVFNARDELVGIVVAGYFSKGQKLFVLSERFRPDTTVRTISDAIATPK